ncbi:hypothetical protein [Shimazuella alba]|uniref:Uncharacterized protein n=1 Tax=Shimazuella alba TaxID=2690964 RepID=A0A6I4VZ25_9BACL|nr:hypothetical protein [Shimazuella alba]MXQ55778.1 hypothetical protein [Shimazuella alba]
MAHDPTANVERNIKRLPRSEAEKALATLLGNAAVQEFIAQIGGTRRIDQEAVRQALSSPVARKNMGDLKKVAPTAAKEINKL